MAMRQQHRGFTLIELMIAVVVVSILAAIALPSYTKYVLRGNRAVVRAALSDLAAKQDVARLRTRSYVSDFSTLNGMTGTSFYIDKTGMVNTSSTAITPIYQVQMINIASDGSAYSLTATPVGNQTKDTDCATLQLNSIGTRSATNSAGAANPDCWVR